jgi:hypothetical protein
MGTMTVENIDSQVREITDYEVTAYEEQGWVALPGLLSAELATAFLDHIKQLTGLDYDEFPPDHPDAEAVTTRIREEGVLEIFEMIRLKDKAAWEIVTSHAIGEGMARLTGSRPMRLLTDGIVCKLPAWTEKAINLGDNMRGTWSGETPWHQDFISVPWDRAGGIQLWVALSEITPEMGAMQYLTGSHREPPLGALYRTEDQRYENLYPELWEKYELSPAHHFLPGDALAHHSLTLHYAQANTTNRLRWAYNSLRCPAGTLYNGIPFPRFTEFGIDIKQWKPFDHPKCPIVTD